MASAASPKRVVIVESPTKATTIARFLDDSYTVESSRGHVRDLPTKADEIPKAYQAEPWARLGIDVDNDFKPLYVLDSAKKKAVASLKKLVASVDELYLATDEDREGEAIAWHLLEVLSPPPQVTVRRLVFHEITPDAIRAALANPRDIDRRLVDAQEARRLLDRLYGYEVSPVLWKKVAPRLSAGRVQSVATRIVVERERERMAFVPAGYWSLEVTAATGAGESFVMAATAVDGSRIAGGRDFGADGNPKSTDVVVLDEAAARRIGADLEGGAAEVTSVTAKPYRRRPAAPFITSTLQQEAGRRLRLSASAAMRIAQSLYEQGFITYMRTDSVTLSDVALKAARAEVAATYGKEFVAGEARRYRSKVRNAQEAHEAIRPAGETFASPESLRGRLTPVEADVYELIWRRTLASQMTDATGETVTIEATSQAAGGSHVTLSASGTVIAHEGFRRAWDPRPSAGAGAGAANGGPEADEAQRRLPQVSVGDTLSLSAPELAGHETQPPARFTEATLVRRLEDLGVGRPSTYATIITTITDRGYVRKKGTALVPTFTAFSVVNLLEGHFGDFVDYAFTARMEDDLDDIARGRREYVPWLSVFYFGAEGHAGLKSRVSDNLDEIDVRAVNAVAIGAHPDGRPIEARLGRFGPYVSCGDERAQIPEDVSPDEVTVDLALELLSRPSTGRSLGTDPASGLPVSAREGRYGPYVQLGPPPETPDAKAEKFASLFASMTLEDITLPDALRLLSLPRTVGVDPSDGVEVTTQAGRFGPYVKKGSETRSLETEEQIFTVSLEDCLALLAQPRRGRGREPKASLRDLGPDPVTGRELVIRDGRWGPYVSDGQTNASLRAGDTPESLTPQRASDLLAARRDAPPRQTRKGGSGGSRRRKGSSARDG
ncbi:MAG: type I DNA topoisomerase [Acidimicrobiia bacterium]|nr:type I DNA topoisomerase [Acidimicrobiia bacterium]MYC44291.1 type I DNA topoisomerase [Acidimicrobiia bacterium]